MSRLAVVLLAGLLAAAPLTAQQRSQWSETATSYPVSVQVMGCGLPREMPCFDRFSFVTGLWGGVATGVGVLVLLEHDEKGIPLVIGGPALAYVGGVLGGDRRAAAWGFVLGMPASWLLLPLLEGS